MPRTIRYPLNNLRRFAFILVGIALMSYLVLPEQYVKWLLPSASATTAIDTKAKDKTPASAVSPGAVSFTGPGFSVNEGDGSANITVTRTGSSAGVLSAKVTLADVTSSPADYALSPGSFDSTFTKPPSITAGSALSYGYPSMALQPDGKLLVTDLRGVWRLNTDGSVDTTFNAGNATNNTLYAVTIQPDGKILIGGGFTTFNNQRVNHIARLNSDGSLDTTFNAGTGTDEDVHLIVVQTDGKVLISGSFQNGDGTQQSGFARLNSDGSRDTSYTAYQGIFKYSLALQPDGKALVGGSGGIDRVNTDGTIDSTFNAHFSGTYPSIFNIALQQDGKIIIAGTFDHLDGQIVYDVARLNADGSLDTTFNTGTGPDINVNGLAIQPDGKVLIGGGFKSFNGTAVNNMVRLNADGSLDTTFTPSLATSSGNSVNNILLQPDGKVFIRGSLTAIGPSFNNTYLARLNNDLFVTWADGDTGNKTVKLPIVDDLLDEPDETLNLTLTPLTSGATTGTNPNATLTIVDNDVPPTITSALPLSFVNISSGKYTHTFTATGYPSPTFTVTSGTLPTGLTLSPTGLLSGTLLRGGLYDNITVTARNGVGSPATQTFSIRVNNEPIGNGETYNTAVNTPLTINAPGVLANDNDANGDPLTAVLETNPLNGSVVVNANGSFTYTPNQNFRGVDWFYYRASDGNSTSSPTQVNIVVLSGGTFQFPSGAAFSVREDAGSIDVQILRLDGTFGTNTVAYSISDGTAHAGVDYTPVSGTVTFASGQFSSSFRISILNDSIKEADETVNLTITSVTGTGTLGAPRTAVLTIIDDDTPALRLSQRNYSVAEGAGSLNIPVTRSGDPAIPVTVNYSTFDTAGLQNCNIFNGIASSRCDYATTIGTLQFAAGETSKNISIPVVDDALVDGNETFSISLTSPVGATIGTIPSATITITDNDTVAGANPVDSVPFFVRQNYIDFLGREPDSFGFKGWQDILNNCTAGDTKCDRIEVSAGFFRSSEFQERGYFTYRFYSVALGRKPNYNEFMPDIAKVSGFLTDAEKEANKVAFVSEFMSRQEFKNRYDSLADPTLYVNALLNTAGLPNHPSRAGWIAGLQNNSLTRAGVLRQLAESAESYQKFYTEAFVVMQYFGYLRRDPDKFYLDWIAIMNQNNGDYRGMVNGFMNSAEYRQRFGQ